MGQFHQRWELAGAVDGEADPLAVAVVPTVDAAIAQGWVDAAGVCHPPAAGPARIVSLVPSLTELLFALDLGDQVVGRTAYCVRPEDRVRRVTSVGGTKTVHLERIQRLEPTHVIVNVDETPRALAETLAEQGYRVIVTHPITVDDNLALYRLLGGIFGCPARAERLCEAFTAARTRLRACIAGRPPLPVLYLIWSKPWMTVSRQTYIAHFLAEAGMATVPAAAAARYPTVTLDEALLADVARVLFASEPFPFRERHLAAFARTYPAHRDKARLIDGQMVSWYGPRAIEAFGYLERFVSLEG
jgi:ABC-type Fe3+-hydroxamate transport system substrate-binding protein